MTYLRKHAKLLKAYSKLGTKVSFEYKTQLWTNFITHCIILVIWFVFWNLMFDQFQEIGHWTYPMLILMVGFFQLSDALWQFGYFTMRLSDEIVQGNLDKYLVRPINPVFGIMMDYFRIESLVPLFMGIIIILFITIKYFSLDLLRMILALFICLLSAIITHFVIICLGLLTFWFGRTRRLISIYKSLGPSKTFPLDIMNKLTKSLLIFIYPAMLMATYPALVISFFTLEKVFLILLIAIITTIFWTIVMNYLWKFGIKRYESMGG